MERARPRGRRLRAPIAVLCAAAGVTGLPLVAAPSPEPRPGPDRRPNFVVFLGDDVGRNDLGAYGHRHIRTPSLDRLAASGLRFDRAFLSISSCSPARGSILTGRYPHSAGTPDAHQFLPADQVSMVEMLRNAGYYTASIGKWHLGRDAAKRFDRVVADVGPSGTDRWVAELQNRPRDRPFFFWLASNDAHRPYEGIAGHPPYDSGAIEVPRFLPDTVETRMDLGAYYEEITRLDDAVGRVRAELDRQQVAGRTLVLFLSDDGRPFPRCKATLFDSGINTPFIIAFPPLVKAGGTSTSLVSAVDIAPTILELAGLKVPATVQGRSFVPILRDPAAKIRDRVFAEQNWHDYTARSRAVRTERYKYIRNSYPDLPYTPPLDAVRSLTFGAMRRLRDRGELRAEQGQCFVPVSEELYDTQADPDEVRNLAGRPDQASVLASLRRSLADWQRETQDREPTQRPPERYDRETGEPLPGTPRPPATPEQ
jgi:arylsulfatase A-like enzyme